MILEDAAIKDSISLIILMISGKIWPCLYEYACITLTYLIITYKECSLFKVWNRTAVKKKFGNIRPF